MTDLAPKKPRRRIGALVAGGVIVLAAGVFTFGLQGAYAQMHGHGANGMGHDMANMPGLRGLDATPEESAELAVMFQNFPKITREVTNLPNGISTVTLSQDEDLMNTVVSHVVGMINRVEEGRDPQVFIQSPTLDILFDRRDSIVTEIDMTVQGIVVIQTSDDPAVVAALQTHAAEVTDMVDRGMQAVHEAMMRRAGN
ncbi:hypothetical protein [Yoonia sp.]|uniref:hypothetical protein n=1 Tax=Yoonia sp. TaxID=2212373 RepID=UPI003F6D5012